MDRRRIMNDKFSIPQSLGRHLIHSANTAHFGYIIEQAMSFGQTIVETVFDLVENGFVGETEPIFDPEADNEVYRVDPEFHRDQRDSIELHSYRWAKQVDAGGTFKDKLKRISEATFDKFMLAKRSQIICHDLDVRRWALAAARRERCNQFKASPSWLRNFKIRHRIVSRKITKFVSRSDVQDREAIENAAIAFQLENTTVTEEIGLENTFNTDQSGCNYETHCGRTLDIAGERKVERVVKSKNATTHSFTIMPTMSGSGVLTTPLYIVMREPKCVFGPQVQQTLFSSPNLKKSYSESGKMGKKHLEEFITDVFVPKTGPKSCLVVDSWSTFTEANIQAAIPVEKKVKILQIPPGATGLIQPWDVWGFRIWKNYIKHIEDFVLLHDISIQLSQRNNCLKLQAIIHDQLRSPRYVNFFKYSWFKAGLTGIRPDHFSNPVRFAFHGTEVDCAICSHITMAKCSWCKLPLCATHFFENVHMCNNYIE
ncbi:Jerky protein homolog-like [Frankliniella fusca]|uniref:Jerky protein homolog-like n=1 Tax=Frankliniella fusca TaxID=407009 RepID=A0AAE1HBG6_9NEOP|nr:Jerky protein homolog-like [Frankliniella fusca]